VELGRDLCGDVTTGGEGSDLAFALARSAHRQALTHRNSGPLSRFRLRRMRRRTNQNPFQARQAPLD
jgi:hypothetical protein